MALILGPIVGGLSPTSANLWGRSAVPGTLFAWLGRAPDLSDAVLAGQSQPLAPENGFTGVVRVADLTPNTRYHYALTLSNSPPAPTAGPYPGFATFPEERGREPFRFVFGSCFRPRDENGGGIFNAIADRLDADGLRFMLLFGDQIYADAIDHNNLDKVATTLDDYRSVYAYAWSRPPLRALFAHLPAFMMMDDHEVDDDWSWTNRRRDQAQIPIWDKVIRWLRGRPREERRLSLDRVRQGLQAYWEHQGRHAPPLATPLRVDSQDRLSSGKGGDSPLAYSFRYGAAAFFVLDTRTQRVKSRDERILLGDSQWAALEAWLLQVKDTHPVKFLATPSSVLFDMWIDPSFDRWNGFPAERQRLLNFLVDHSIEGVTILTGDLHSAHATRVDLLGSGGQKLSVWEFCSSPFEQSPNRLAKYTFRPLREPPVRRQQLAFVRNQPNFGVVAVAYPADEQPEVVFSLYGKRGQLLETVRSGG